MINMEKERRHMTLTFPVDLYEKVKRKAKEQKRSTGRQIELYVEKGIEAIEQAEKAPV
jgi:hypothetical protein